MSNSLLFLARWILYPQKQSCFLQGAKQVSLKGVGILTCALLFAFPYALTFLLCPFNRKYISVVQVQNIQHKCIFVVIQKTYKIQNENTFLCTKYSIKTYFHKFCCIFYMQKYIFVLNFICTSCVMEIQFQFYVLNTKMKLWFCVCPTQWNNDFVSIKKQNLYILV